MRAQQSRGITPASRHDLFIFLGPKGRQQQQQRGVLQDKVARPKGGGQVHKYL